MDAEKLIEAIQHINEKFSDKEWAKAQNGNVLSYTAMKLAAMKAYLIDVKSNAYAELLDAEIELETYKGMAYKKYKESDGATAAQDMKNLDEDYIEAKRYYAGRKVFYEKLKSVVADSHDLIETLRSRIIDLQGSRKDESIR
jgi:hypothetical protein